MQPIDYGVQIADPTQAFLGAFKTGAVIQEAGLKQQQQQQALEQQKLIQAQFTKIRSPDATVADVANLAMILPKDQSQALRDSFALRTDAQKQNTLNATGKIVSAFFAGENDIAANLIDQQATAKKNSGDVEGANFLTTFRDITNINPKASQEFFTAQLLLLPGGEKIVENIIKLQQEGRDAAKGPSELAESEAKAKQAQVDAQTKVADLRIKLQNEPIEAERLKIKRDLELAQQEEAAIKARYAEQVQIKGLDKTNWDIKNLQSQINDRSAKLNLDKQITQATVQEKLSAIAQRLTDIPEGARKLINEAATQSATSKQAATQYNDLATRIEAAQGGKGRLTSASEWFATQSGKQDAWTQIRNEYTRVRNSVAIKALPPGVATDKDIELALKGIPPETANAATLASFLRGTAKLQDIDSAINNAKTDWLSQNNGLLTRAKRTFIAGDYSAKAGETFNDFAQSIVGDVASKYRSPAQVAEDQRQQLIQQIPTNLTPAAAPPQTSVETQADAILRGGRP